MNEPETVERMERASGPELAALYSGWDGPAWDAPSDRTVYCPLCGAMVEDGDVGASAVWWSARARHVAWHERLGF